MTKLLLLSLMLTGLCLNLKGQTKENEKTDTSVITVFTKSGDVIKGYLISQNKDSLTFNSVLFGRMSIASSEVDKIFMGDISADEVNKQPEKKEVEFPPSARFKNEQNYILTSSAFNIKMGESTLKNNILTYCYGFYDNFSVGFGTSILALTGGVGVIFLRPKFSHQLTDYIRIKVGLDAFAGASFDGGGAAGALINTGFTIGNPDIHFTTSAYYGAISDVEPLKLIYSLAGAARISKQYSFVGENIIYGFRGENYNYISIGGLRFHAKKGTVDVGLFYINDGNNFAPVLPYLGLAFKL